MLTFSNGLPRHGLTVVKHGSIPARDVKQQIYLVSLANG
jgi:hypothetical protein